MQHVSHEMILEVVLGSMMSLPYRSRVGLHLRSSSRKGVTRPRAAERTATECESGVARACRVGGLTSGQRRSRVRKSSDDTVFAPAAVTSVRIARSLVTTTTGLVMSMLATSARSTSSADTPAGE